MRIENLRTQTKNNLVRVSATVSYEDCDRPTQDIYFETSEKYAEGLWCNPHAFLTASIMPALHFGEKRVSIDAEICPELHHGLITAMSFIRHWFYQDNSVTQIEAKIKQEPLTDSVDHRAGFFFSGGVDSLYTLRSNRLNFSLNHPRSYQDGLLILGLNQEPHEDLQQQLESHHLKLLSKIAKEAKINLIPVSSNLRYWYNDVKFWQNEFQGAVLSSVAHAFSKQLTDVTIASSFPIPYLFPYGSHPLLDPNYSSSNLRIRHGSNLLSRFEKTKIVAHWDVAVQNLKVCTTHEYNKLNCGRCEKCLRTMTALAALGVLDKTQAFAQPDVTEELLLSGAYIQDAEIESCYLDCIPGLIEQGRDDLVRGIKRIINRYHEKDLKGLVRRLDRQLFQGNLVEFAQKYRSRKTV